MLKARISYKLVGFLSRILPSSAASSIVRLLGLKIPTTPPALAASLMVQAGTMLETIEKAVAELRRADFKVTVESSVPLEPAAEIVSALYCLAVVVLGEDEFASEPNLYQLYTAKTFEELETLYAGMKPSPPLEAVIEEATKLYLHDNPDLNELARRKPDFMFAQEAQKVREMNNWTTTFLLKAKVRILEKLSIRKNNLAYIPLGHLVQTFLVENVKLFQQMRPVFVEPS